MLDTWELDGVHTPHDIALSAAPVTATLGGSRSLAVYVAETARGRASHLHKFIIHHPSEYEEIRCRHSAGADTYGMCDSVFQENMKCNSPLMLECTVDIRGLFGLRGAALPAVIRTVRLNHVQASSALHRKEI